MNKSKYFVLTTIALCSIQIIIIILSWIITAIFPEHGFNSLLSGSGLRWLLSKYINNEYSNFCIWFLFFSFFVGTFIWSKLPKKIISYSQCDYNDKFAIKVFFFEIAIGIILCLTLVLYPNSSFLGISGNLFPGPFASASFFIIGMAFFIGSTSYLILSERLKTYKEAERLLVFGIQAVAPLIVIIFLLKKTLEIIKFVFLN